MVPKFIARPVDYGSLGPNLNAYFYCSEYHEFERFDWATASEDKFAKQLANIHSNTQSTYGYDFPTYIGNHRQYIARNPSWKDFFIEMLRSTADQYHQMPQLSSEGQMKSSQLKDILDETIKNAIPKLLGPLDKEIKPQMIHGDLSLDNIKLDHDTGQPYIFSPACLYAHYECKFSDIPNNLFEMSCSDNMASTC
jgi:protein-ribulosamine 3-kinase